MKQSGFSVIELLIVIAALGLIAGGGYYVFARSNSTKASSASSSQSAPANTIDQAVTNYGSNKTALNEQAAKITVEKQNDQHALGQVVSANGESLGIWFASKQNGSWKVDSQNMSGQCDNLTAAGLSQWDVNCTP